MGQYTSGVMRSCMFLRSHAFSVLCTIQGDLLVQCKCGNILLICLSFYLKNLRLFSI